MPGNGDAAEHGNREMDTSALSMTIFEASIDSVDQTKMKAGTVAKTIFLIIEHNARTKGRSIRPQAMARWRGVSSG